MAREAGLGYRWSLVAMVAGLLGQVWGTAVLLVSRQFESLLLASTIASVLWFWCFWACVIGRRLSGFVLTAVGVAFSILISGLGLLDMLDPSSLSLMNG